MVEFLYENLLLLLPLLALELGLIVYCAVKIFKEGVANLNKWQWLVIVVLTNLAGATLFLLVGRRRDLY